MYFIQTILETFLTFITINFSSINCFYTVIIFLTENITRNSQAIKKTPLGRSVSPCS